MLENRVNSSKSLFSRKKAHEAQARLSEKIIFEDQLPKDFRLVAGVDVAYAGDTSIGAAVVMDYHSLEIVETKTALCKTRFPYIPTLLSFRETPPTVRALSELHTQPDLVLVDGQGYAHPYRCGLASHLGLIIQKPTIGVAKSKLVGELETCEVQKNVYYLKHKAEIVGAGVRTKPGAKLLYVSVGHMISLTTAIRVVKECTRRSHKPEPILKAHEAATQRKRKAQSSPRTSK